LKSQYLLISNLICLNLFNTLKSHASHFIFTYTPIRVVDRVLKSIVPCI